MRPKYDVKISLIFDKLRRYLLSDDFFTQMNNALSRSQGKVKLAQAQRQLAKTTEIVYVAKFNESDYKVYILWENDEIREKACSIWPEIEDYIHRYCPQVSIYAKIWHPRDDYEKLMKNWDKSWMYTRLGE